MIDAFTQGRLLNVLCSLQALAVEAKGMESANADRDNRGHSMAYGEDAFQKIADQMRSLGNEALEIGQGR